MRPKTALGVMGERDLSKPPPQKRKLQTRHTFDGVTINIISKSKGDYENKKRHGDDSSRPRSSHSRRRESRGATPALLDAPPRESIPRDSAKSGAKPRPNTARLSCQRRPSVSNKKLRPISAHATKV